MKTHKRKKSSRMHGRKMGTHGHGSRKQHRLGGKEGGRGMAGSGKRADQRKTLITKLYGHSYFGKKGVTSRKSARDKRKKINIGFIQDNLESFGNKTAKGWEIDLKNTKILGGGEVREKLIIKASEASKSALDKISKAGGEIVLVRKKEEEKSSEEISEDEK